MSERVFIIGAGQVGRGLSRAFRASGQVELIGLHGRRPSDFAMSSGELPATIAEANVILVAVRDPQIDDVLRQIQGRSYVLRSGTVVFHTSGIADPTGFQALRASGFSCGTFHPIVPFADVERATMYLKRGWIGLDGDASARSTGRRLAAHLGARTVDIPPGSKAQYHAAAVFASNFPIVLAALAEQLLRDTGIPDRSASQVVASLMLAAVENVGESGAVQALTGPIVRGDLSTVRQHVQGLTSHQEAHHLYRELSRAALAIARARGVDSDILSELERLLRLDDARSPRR